MSTLRRMLDSVHPQFAEGGKYERLYPLYEAIDTFLYTPDDVTQGPSHIRDAMDLKRMMITVVIALTPCILMAFYNTGYQANLALESLGVEQVPGWRGAILTSLGLEANSSSFLANFLHGGLYFIPVFLVCNLVGGAWEVLFSCVRGHEVNEGFMVTGMLFPLTLPPSIPLWQVAVGISFGVVIGKEVFGGTGKNFLNPALTARAFLYFAYPAQMSGDKVWVAVNPAVAPDGYSAATPLGQMASAPIEQAVSTANAFVQSGIDLSWSQAFFGWMPGSMGETSTLACLIGAGILILTQVGSWRIMLSTLIGAMGSAMLLWSLFGQSGAHLRDNPMFQYPPEWQLVTGGLAFGLVFMATDPVSASMTQKGKWVYGLLIGLFTTLIRVINPGYPEGIMLAILLGNLFAPIIDYVVVQANIRRRIARSAA